MLLSGNLFLIKLSLTCPKKGSDKVRLIHDASRGDALNDFAEPESFQYQTINDAIQLIKPGSYMAKVDLSNAYRVVRIHPSNWEFTEMKWTSHGYDSPTYMVDTGPAYHLVPGSHP